MENNSEDELDFSSGDEGKLDLTDVSNPASKSPSTNESLPYRSLYSTKTTLSFETTKKGIGPNTPFEEKIQPFMKDDESFQVKLESEVESLREIRKKIILFSKNNFILEKELIELDEKIKRLIKNLLTVQEIYAGSAVLKNSDRVSIVAPLKNTRKYYEQLFFLLQQNPMYLASLAPYVTGKNIPPFVQTLVFDMYGDQFDSGEERLLLSLFQMVLRKEMEKSTEIGSLMRANTAASQMLSAYTRRGVGISILKNVIGEPLKNVLKDKDLNLELSPSKIYAKIISDYESSTGKEWPEPKLKPDDELMNEYVIQEEMKQRLNSLRDICQEFVNRIIGCLEQLPYGVRWICKQYREISEDLFPNATKYQVGSVIGGYINLRFFTPAIVTPDALNIIDERPGKIPRNNLVTIAKVIQNLSNGQYFSDHKDKYMKELNSFIDANRDSMTDFFFRLAEVEDLEYRLKMDKFLAYTTTRNSSISTTLNQIYLIHELLVKHVDLISLNRDDVLRSILAELGSVPEQVDHADNENIILELVPYSRADERLAESIRVDSNSYEHLNGEVELFSIQRALQGVFRETPNYILTRCKSLNEALTKSKEHAHLVNNHGIIEDLEYIESLFDRILEMQVSERKFSDRESVFEHICKSSLERILCFESLLRKKSVVERAYSVIQEHSSYLEGQLEDYRVYLENTKQGGAQTIGGALQATLKFTKKEHKKKVKFSHAKLEDKRVIEWTDPNVAKVLKKCTYVFSMEKPGLFRVDVTLRKGISLPFTSYSMELKLDDLLQMKDNLQTTLDMHGHIKLNLNLVIHLLNKNFIAGS